MDKLLSLDQVAEEVLSTSRRTVERMIAAGKLPQPVKVGRSSRLFASDVEAYLDDLREKRDR